MFIIISTVGTSHRPMNTSPEFRNDMLLSMAVSTFLSPILFFRYGHHLTDRMSPSSPLASSLFFQSLATSAAFSLSSYQTSHSNRMALDPTFTLYAIPLADPASF